MKYYRVTKTKNPPTHAEGIKEYHLLRAKKYSFNPPPFTVKALRNARDN